jgi:hypothetical protein
VGGSGELVVMATAGFTRIERGWEPLAPAASVAETVKLLVVGLETELGVPLNTPPLDKFITGGTAPDVTCQPRGNVPPVALRVREQNVPAVQSANEVVEMEGAGLITSATVFESDPPSVSVAVTVTLKVPDWVGVPLSTGVFGLPIPMPAGSPLADQL